MLILLPFVAAPAKADDWMLRVQTMGRVCHVQLKTAAPLGEDFKGPFPSRKAACQEAANQHDSSLSDQSKCWTYGSGTVTGLQEGWNYASTNLCSEQEIPSVDEEVGDP
jgi:hypothetical protein